MKFKHIILGISLIVLDILIYIFLGLLLMQYDDFYNESKGEYWSLASMTFTEKIYFIGFILWNIINLLASAVIVFRTIMWIKKRRIKT